MRNVGLTNPRLVGLPRFVPPFSAVGPVLLYAGTLLMQTEFETSWFPRPFLLLKWGILGAVISALWLAVNYDRLEDYFEARARRSEASRTVQTMERQYSQLLHEKQELERWGFSAEKAIRERLKMARPGENVIILEEPRGESDFSLPHDSWRPLPEVDPAPEP